MQRWIVHVDMDAFFAAIEQRDNKEFQGKPVIVGGLSSRGVVSTASYEARRFGVHSAMPMTEARRRCPQGIFLTGDHAKYSIVSKQIQAILTEFSPTIEPLSLDEAFLDVSGMEYLYPDLVELARRIKSRIKTETGLVASVGVAANKFLAKLASDLEKPDGLVMIPPGQEEQFLQALPVSRLWGVGEATAQVLHKIGIQTIGQLAQCNVELLVKQCGQSAYVLHALAHGQDDRAVVPEREPQSVGKEETFTTDLLLPSQIETELLNLSEKVGWRLRQLNYSGRTITVKIRFASFRTITRSRTLTEPTNFDNVIYQTVSAIYKNCSISEGIRLLGVTVSNLQSGSGQMSLFDDSDDKQAVLYNAVDKLKERFGEGIITKARLLR